MAFSDLMQGVNRACMNAFAETVIWKRGTGSPVSVSVIPGFPEDGTVLSADAPPSFLQFDIEDASFPSNLAPGPQNGDRIVFLGSNYVVHQAGLSEYGMTHCWLKKL